MHRCGVELHELHALVLQLFPGSQVEHGDGFFCPYSGGQVCCCVLSVFLSTAVDRNSAVLQAIAGAPCGHP